MIVVMVAMLVLSLDGVLGRVDGAILLVGFVGYLVLVLRTARKEPAAVGAEYEEFEEVIEAFHERFDVTVIDGDGPRENIHFKLPRPLMDSDAA